MLADILKFINKRCGLIIVVLVIILIIVLFVKREYYDPAIVGKLNVIDNINLVDTSNNSARLYMEDGKLTIDLSNNGVNETRMYKGRLISPKRENYAYTGADIIGSNPLPTNASTIISAEQCVKDCIDKNGDNVTLVSYNKTNNKCYCKKNYNYSGLTNDINYNSYIIY